MILTKKTTITLKTTRDKGQGEGRWCERKRVRMKVVVVRKKRWDQKKEMRKRTWKKGTDGKPEEKCNCDASKERRKESKNQSKREKE